MAGLNRIKELRIAAGLSQRKLGNSIGTVHISDKRSPFPASAV